MYPKYVYLGKLLMVNFLSSSKKKSTYNIYICWQGADLWLKGGKVLQVKGKILPIFMAAKGAQLYGRRFIFYLLSHLISCPKINFILFFSFPFFVGLYYVKGNKMPKKCRFHPNQGFSLRNNYLDVDGCKMA